MIFLNLNNLLFKGNSDLRKKNFLSNCNCKNNKLVFYA